MVFLLLLAVMYKFAWKPILAGLDSREAGIRAAVDNAEKITAQLAEIESQRASIIGVADDKAKEIVTAARDAAKEAAERALRGASAIRTTGLE